MHDEGTTHNIDTTYRLCNNKSTQPDSINQFYEKDSTNVDTKPGLKFQESKKDSTLKVDKQLGGADGVGDVAGVNEVGDVAGGKTHYTHVKSKVECKICGNWSKNISENKKHLSNTHSEYAISITKEFSSNSFNKPTKLLNCVSCNRNFFFYQTWERHIMKCHNVMGIIGGGDEPLINLDSSFETDEEDVDGENGDKNNTVLTIKTPYFTEKHWGTDENANPAGINFKSKKSDFKKSVDKLKKVFRKGSVKSIGKTSIHVEDVKRKSTLTEVKINITDPEGEGDVILSIWSPNKKNKETTLQINTVKGNDKRFVKLFAQEFVKVVIERISMGMTVDDLFEKGEAKVACSICRKMFAKEATLKIHMKTHIICHKCGKGFKEECELKNHKVLVHNSKPYCKDAMTEDIINTCEDCGHTAQTRKSLMVHKENNHIEDSWLINTKRNQDMMNSEQEHKSTKTEEPNLKKSKKNDTESEAQLKQLSDNMDKKVLQKRKLEEEKEFSWLKEKEKVEILKNKRVNEDKQKYNFLQDKVNKQSAQKEEQEPEKGNPKESTINNEKSLPKSVERIVGNNYELERVLGDGACGMRSFTKHAFGDASLGPYFGELLNKEIANNFWNYKQLLEWPYDRPVGGSEAVKFEQNEEDKLLDFLRNHPRNGFVWRGFMDMQALSNKYNMPIQIISITDINDINPKVERIEPDRDFEFTEKVEEMILLSTGKVHFDLIMKKKQSDSPKDTKDILNVEKNQEDVSIINDSEEKRKHNTQEDSSRKCEVDMLRLKLAQSRQEIKDLQDLVKTLLPDEKVDMFQKKSNSKDEATQNNICGDCGLNFAKFINLEAHVRKEHSMNNTYSCTKCKKEYSTKENLWSHNNEEHSKRFNCDSCEESFANDQELKMHDLVSTHLSTIVINVTFKAPLKQP